MIEKYKIISIVYGGTGREYASKLNEKIKEFSMKERYPISSRIILDSILTGDLLNGTIRLFKESDVCVTFLTADDLVVLDNGNRKRIRQNVVFELAMALIQLGREKCIVLSDFDPNSNEIELPSDINGLEIKYFQKEQLDNVIIDIINKILDLDLFESEEMSRYDYLLTRDTYYLQYEKLFNYSLNLVESSNNFLNTLLDEWYEECSSLSYFDEKSVYILERVAFLPIFGKTSKTTEWIKNIKTLFNNYSQKEIEYYKDVKLLSFTRNLVLSVLNYTYEKQSNEIVTKYQYQKTLDSLLFSPPHKEENINPLLLLIYYDYLGLTEMHVALLENDKIKMQKAKQHFQKANSYVYKVDMSLDMWAGFMQDNLARVNEFLDNIEDAGNMYKRGACIRGSWLSITNCNINIRNALSFGYFIAQITYLKFANKHNLISKEDLRDEYIKLETELNSYFDKNDGLERLVNIKDSINKEKDLLNF